MTTWAKRILDWPKTVSFSLLLGLLCAGGLASLAVPHSVSAATNTYTVSGSYTVPANVTSLVVEVAGGGGEAGSGCDGGGGPDGAPGEQSSLSYGGVVKATAYGGGGGPAVEPNRCDFRGHGTDGSGLDNGLTSTIITTGGGAPGQIADGDSYANGGNGGAGGKVTGTLAVTAGQVVSFVVGTGFNGNGWVKISDNAPAPSVNYTTRGVYSYEVPANVTSLVVEMAGGGGDAGAGCDGGGGEDGAPGGSSSIEIQSVVQAMAFGGGGGLAVEPNRCDTRGDGAAGSAINYTLTSATITVGGGAPGLPANGDSYVDGGDGGNGGKMVGTLAVTPGQILTIVVGLGYNGDGWVKISEDFPTFTFTSSTTYTVPANAATIVLEIAGGGGEAGAGCDGGGGSDGQDGGASSVTYGNVLQAVADGGKGGLAVEPNRCDPRGDGADGSATNYDLSSTAITVGGGAPGQIAEGDSYANGGNGGAGGKIVGTLAVTPGQVLDIVVGNGYNGNGWVTGKVYGAQ